MMKSSVTISLVPEARGGPFVFWEDLDASCAKAAELGFDAVEIFPPGPDAIARDRLHPLLDRYGLQLAAVGTGGGWVLHRLALTSPDATVRSQAIDFIRSIVDAAGQLGAPTIVGSMQGRWTDAVPRDRAMGYLIDALDELGNHAQAFNVPLLFEPLNRYETNMINTLADGTALIGSLRTGNVKLLADLFHMNIEEADLGGAIRAEAGVIGHVHLADSNRRPAGGGHSHFQSIAAALNEIEYEGYLSAECLPWPDPARAAAATIEAFGRYFRPGAH